MTNQEAYDKVKAHLLAQGKRSEDIRSCLYRGPDNTKCAVGCLLPDDIYKPDMERREIASLLVYYPELNSHFSGVDPNLLIRLQDLHDNVVIGRWPKRLSKVAKMYNLNP